MGECQQDSKHRADLAPGCGQDQREAFVPVSGTKLTTSSSCSAATCSGYFSRLMQGHRGDQGSGRESPGECFSILALSWECLSPSFPGATSLQFYSPTTHPLCLFKGCVFRLSAGPAPAFILLQSLPWTLSATESPMASLLL